MKICFRFFPWLATLCLWLAAGGADAAPLRVLLLTGSNNHDWRSTTPVLKEILEAQGRFRVDVETNVPALTAQSFSGYDAVLSHFNTFGGNLTGEVWGAETRAAFAGFIRQGGGLVVVHAGSSVFYDWPEFQQLAGATWASGKTGHGRMHTNEVHLVGDHPVTAGLTHFSTCDEFWQNSRIDPAAQTLAEVTPNPEFKGSGKPEPVVLATHLGRGRGFTLLLGHDAQAMRNPGFARLLRRGAEWAATGKISPDNL